MGFKSAIQLSLALLSLLAAPQAKSSTGAEPYKVLQPGELVFYNADHSPFGAYCSFVYGLDGNQGAESTKPVDLLIGSIAHSTILSRTESEQFMPFLDKALGQQIGLIQKQDIKRVMRACTDNWTAGPLSWSHYTPAWYMQKWDTATVDEKKRFVLPATWMEIKFDNTRSTVERTLVVGLPVQAAKKTFSGGEEGFVFDQQALSVSPGTCQLWETDDLNSQLDTQIKSGFAFALTVPPGQVKSLIITSTVYRPGRCFGSDNVYYYTKLFSNMDDVVAQAGRQFQEAKSRSLYLDQKLQNSGQNLYRQFLAGHALHSYLYNTAFLAKPDDAPVFIEMEGEYDFLNTLDLTVDHVFYQLAMYPWITRTLLDQFSDKYSYFSKAVDPLTQQSSANLISFTHDMGRNVFSPKGKSAYEGDSNHMSQEELQNWILCAALYWKKSGDEAWLKKNMPIFSLCLQSMLQRDALEPAQRDGLTSLIHERGEITTYDALDDALESPLDNVYVGVKSWASYLALEAIFNKAGQTDNARTAHDQAVRCSQTVVQNYKETEHYIPALLNGKNTSRIIPIVEGLIYPAQMGLTDATSVSGPYGAMIKVLQAHLEAVLRPGVCLDARTGAWKLSSTSNNTWQSKVYLAQYIAENILGIKDDRTNGRVDAVHATFEVLGTPATCWSDQLNSTDGSNLGSAHYPRGVTSALWWLDSGR